MYIARLLPNLANEEKWEQLQLTLDNSNPKKDKAMKRVCSRQSEFELSNVKVLLRMSFFFEGSL